MQVFRYKDRNLKYTYMTALSILYLTIFIPLLFSLSGSLELKIGLYLFFSIPAFTALTVALSNLLERIIIKSEEVVFSRIFSRHIRYSDINEIRKADNGNLGIEIIRNGRPIVNYFSICESTQDILIYKQAFRTLLQKTHEVKPNITIQQQAWQIVEPTSTMAVNLEKRREEIFSSTKGLGGWLGFIAFMLIIGVLIDFTDIAQNVSKLIQSSSFNIQNVGILANNVLRAAPAAFAIIALIRLLQKKALFSKSYIIYLSVNIIVQFIIQVINLVTGNLHYGVLITLFQITMSMAYSITMLFAIRTYLHRSIRVKNTLIN